MPLYRPQPSADAQVFIKVIKALTSLEIARRRRTGGTSAATTSRTSCADWGPHSQIPLQITHTSVFQDVTRPRVFPGCDTTKGLAQAFRVASWPWSSILHARVGHDMKAARPFDSGPGSSINTNRYYYFRVPRRSPPTLCVTIRRVAETGHQGLENITQEKLKRLQLACG